MQAQDVFHKTAKGQLEIDQKAADLSMRERRVLILINGQRTAGQVRQMSMVENFSEVVDKLRAQGFIGIEGGAPQSVPAPFEPAKSATVIDFPEPEETPSNRVDPRVFMTSSLLRFANRIRVKDLLAQIENASDTQNLKALVKPWYNEIAESPTGIFEADDLKTTLLDLLLEEEVEGV